MCCIEVVAETLGTQKDDHNEIRIDTGHENADHLAIIVTLRNALGRGKWEFLPNLGFDGGTGGRNEVTKLVRRSHHKRADRARGQLHQMDGDDTPCALDAELFKEGSSHNRLGGNVGIWVQQRASDDTDGDDGESSAKDLAGPAAESAARDST